MLVQKVETDSALSKAVSIANKSAEPKVYQRPRCSRMDDSSCFLFLIFFLGVGLVDTGTGLAWLDQFSVPNLMEREAHPTWDTLLIALRSPLVNAPKLASTIEGQLS